MTFFAGYWLKIWIVNEIAGYQIFCSINGQKCEFAVKSVHLRSKVSICGKKTCEIGNCLLLQGDCCIAYSTPNNYGYGSPHSALPIIGVPVFEIDDFRVGNTPYPCEHEKLASESQIWIVNGFIFG